MDHMVDLEVFYLGHLKNFYTIQYNTIHSFTCKLHYACLSFVSIHQMAPAVTEVADIQLQLTTHLSTRTVERLSWPGWLAYTGWLTQISGHPSTIGRAHDREVRWPHINVLPLCHATNWSPKLLKTIEDCSLKKCSIFIGWMPLPTPS